MIDFFTKSLNPLHYRGLPQREKNPSSSLPPRVSIPFITGAYLKATEDLLVNVSKSQSPSLPGLTSKHGNWYGRRDRGVSIPFITGAYLKAMAFFINGESYWSQSPSLPGLTSKYAPDPFPLGLGLNPLHYRGLPQRVGGVHLFRVYPGSQSPSLPGLTSK